MPRRRAEIDRWPVCGCTEVPHWHRSGLYSRDIVVGITVNGENMEAALQMLKEILVQTDP